MSEILLGTPSLKLVSLVAYLGLKKRENFFQYFLLWKEMVEYCSFREKSFLKDFPKKTKNYAITKPATLAAKIGLIGGLPGTVGLGRKLEGPFRWKRPFCNKIWVNFVHFVKKRKSFRNSFSSALFFLCVRVLKLCLLFFERNFDFPVLNF